MLQENISKSYSRANYKQRHAYAQRKKDYFFCLSQRLHDVIVVFRHFGVSYVVFGEMLYNFTQRNNIQLLWHDLNNKSRTTTSAKLSNSWSMKEITLPEAEKVLFFCLEYHLHCCGTRPFFSLLAVLLVARSIRAEGRNGHYSEMRGGIDYSPTVDAGGSHTKDRHTLSRCAWLHYFCCVCIDVDLRVPYRLTFPGVFGFSFLSCWVDWCGFYVDSPNMIWHCGRVGLICSCKISECEPQV